MQTCEDEDRSAKDASRFFRHAVYEIECNAPDHRYVGFSEDVVRRVGTHLLGKGARFTKQHGVKAARILCFLETEDEAKRVKQAWRSVLQSRRYRVRT